MEDAVSAQTKQRAKSYQLTAEKFLSPQELEKVQSLFDDSRDSLLIEFALRTGARATEILNVSVSDLDPETKTVFIRGIKGSNDRSIVLPTAFYNKLHARASEGRIFPISYSRLDQIWDKYRPAKKKFHALRHTFAMQVFRKTKDIKLTMQLLGHRDIKNTMIYLDYETSYQEQKKIMNKLY